MCQAFAASIWLSWLDYQRAVTGQGAVITVTHVKGTLEKARGAGEQGRAA